MSSPNCKRYRLLRVVVPLFMLMSGWFVLVSITDAEPVQKPNYKLAYKYSPENLRQFTYSTSVRPRWIGKTDEFWYEYSTSKGKFFYRVNPKARNKTPLFDQVKLAAQLTELGKIPVDANQLPITRVRINAEGDQLTFVANDYQYEYDLKAEKLTKKGKAPPARRGRGPNLRGTREEKLEQLKEYLQERFGNRRFDKDRLERMLEFYERRQRNREEDEERDQEEDRTNREEQRGWFSQFRSSRRRSRSYKNYAPDKKVYVFAQKHNLYLAEEGKENKALQLSKDGKEDYSFGGSSDSNRKSRPRATWSKDSKAFYVTRRDSRDVQELFLVNSLASPRPKLMKYKYPMPGEEKIRKSELYYYLRDSKKLIRVKPKWKDESYSNIHWGDNGEELRFIRRDRLWRNIEICSLNTKTGKAKCLIAEEFENAKIEYQPVRYIKETQEMIWWSERSGWGHFYLYDRNGKAKNPITQGNFRASRIVDVDAKKRLLYFRANGREPGESVYNQHLYCIHLDGNGITLMDPGSGYHRSELSPSRHYVVDNCSRIDMAPISILRDAKGKELMVLEKADLSRLYEAGWKMPETFKVKAADGVTDLYGNMWKPFDFDPKKKYPIIAHVYPGPQQEGLSHTFSATNSRQQLAQLGFIVIQVGHRGGAPTRSKAYHSHSYFNLRDYGLADKKAAIEQLAARHSFIDINRVGIYGHSGGGFMSAAAVLQKPYNEFFKVAVASAGNHDNNIYNNSWAERYHGMKLVKVKKGEDKSKSGRASTASTGRPQNQQQKDKKQNSSKENEKDKKANDNKEEKKVDEETRFEIKVPTNAELAANLKGHLLLVHGEMDNNVHPANTMRLVDALIKANKRFDMLIIPGKRHSFGNYQAYFRQRMWEYFAEHLLGDRQTGADIFDKKK